MDLLGMTAEFPSIYDDPQLVGSDWSNLSDPCIGMTQKKLTEGLLSRYQCLSPLLLTAAPSCSG